jgi:predicted regulator of Ras-like GTPase activity (Roadblock/LC7/MglB family)
MNFEPTLRKMIDGVPGALGIALMGSDGIPIAEVAGPGSADGDPGDGEGEVGAIGVEFGRILEEVRKASDGVAGGRLEEMVVGLARFWLLFRLVDEELFVVAALAPSGNLGKARFLMRRHLLALQEEL